MHEQVATSFQRGASLLSALQQAPSTPHSAILKVAVAQHGSAASQQYMQGRRELNTAAARQLSSHILMLNNASRHAAGISHNAEHAAVMLCRIAEERLTHDGAPASASDSGGGQLSCARPSASLLEAAMLAAQAATEMQREVKVVQAACSGLHFQMGSGEAERLSILLESGCFGLRELLPALNGVHDELTTQHLHAPAD